MGVCLAFVGQHQGRAGAKRNWRSSSPHTRGDTPAWLHAVAAAVVAAASVVDVVCTVAPFAPCVSAPSVVV